MYYFTLKIQELRAAATDRDCILYAQINGLWEVCCIEVAESLCIVKIPCLEGGEILRFPSLASAQIAAQIIALKNWVIRHSAPVAILECGLPEERFQKDRIIFANRRFFQKMGGDTVGYSGRDFFEKSGQFLEIYLHWLKMVFELKAAATCLPIVSLDGKPTAEGFSGERFTINDRLYIAAKLF